MSHTGKELVSAPDMGIHSMFPDFSNQNIKDGKGEEDLEKADICKIYKDSFKMDSVPPVRSLTQLGTVGHIPTIFH